jgi:sugar/nucleoside kinase (ribokinase family)
VLVCTLGDALLDVIVRVERPFERDDDSPARTRVGAGGQAANVAAWAASLGADARVVARLGDDDVGRLVAAELRARRVELSGPVAGTTGVVVSIVEADGRRSLLSDPGAAPGLRPEELDVRWLRGCDVLHLSGYALVRRPIDEAGARAAGAVKAQGGRISVDLATWTAIRDFGAERLRVRLAELEPDVVFATERELEVLGAEPSTATLVVKRGADGCTVVGVGQREDHAALPVEEVVDTTGAGDALAAGFLVGGIELGLDAAARCVSQLGAMP